MTTTPRPVNPDPTRTDVPIESAPTLGSADQPFVTVGLAPGEPHAASVGSLQRIGDYTILGKLGEGGMGTVYRAEDSQLGRRAAIKTMKPELAVKPHNRERFLREARAAAAVEHDNIVPIWQIGQAADGSPFIAMPLLQGEMLDDRLRREPVPNLGILLKVAREVADGLGAAHARGLIHRDIKPSNVWLEGDLTAKDLAHQVRRCKILDFGLARSVGTDDAHLTASGTILGTPAYMAPEQARGETVDPRADLFSLGVLLYRMATGRLPFEGSNMMSVLTSLATITPPSVRTLKPNLPPALSDLIDRMLCKDAAGRPQTAAEVAATVRQIQKELHVPPLAPLAVPVAPAPANPWEDITIVGHEPASPMPNRRRTALIVSICLLALLPVAAWLGVVIVRMETNEGTLVVEISDPEVEARIKGGKLILTGADGKKQYILTPAERSKKLEPGPYKIRVEGADGLVVSTPKFELRKGGEVTVRVTMVPKVVAKVNPPNLDPDRKAAEYVLSIGGKVMVASVDREIDKVADLPKEAFQLWWVQLFGNKRANDAGMANFEGCTNLTAIGLEGTKVGDEGMAYFKNCKNVHNLSLANTQVSDAGLVHFKDCKNLMHLMLRNTQVTDAVLARFTGLENLRTLELTGTKVTDVGLVPFRGCRKLEGLELISTKISDKGMANFKDCTSLNHLALANTQVTDEGLANFAGCKGWTYFELNNMPGLTDAGLAHFKDCKDLSVLGLNGTSVTDKGLALFKECKKLKILGVAQTKVTDVGLAYFEGYTTLLWLQLSGASISDKGLANFAGCKDLEQLWLNETKITDEGLAHFAGCKKLTQLNLQLTPMVTDKGLGNFRACKNLTYLAVGGTKIGDVGVSYFADCKNLTYLNVPQTKVTAAKVAELQKALPKCKIEWDGGVIEPAAK